MSSKAERTGFKKKARARVNKYKTKNRGPSSKKRTTKSHPLRRKAGYLITALICMILIAGSIGVSPDRPSRNIPQTPPPLTNGTVFFAPLAVPDLPLSPLLSTKMSLTWDRSDIFLVVADGDRGKSAIDSHSLRRSNPLARSAKLGTRGTRSWASTTQPVWSG